MNWWELVWFLGAGIILSMTWIEVATTIHERLRRKQVKRTNDNIEPKDGE